VVSYSRNVLGPRELFFIYRIEEMLLQLVYCYKALKAAIHIAIVRIILKADNAIGELRELLEPLLGFSLCSDSLCESKTIVDGWYHIFVECAHPV
jgi:hypothetical protein